MSTVCGARIGAVGYGSSFVLLAVGLLCLLADLGRPAAFYLLFTSPTLSLISVGTFALTVFFLCAGIALADAVLTLGPRWGRLALAAKIVGVPVAVVVMIYTGLLLQSVVAERMWQSSSLPVLFLASALSCGCGIALIAAAACEDQRALRRWSRAVVRVDLALIGAEVVAAVAFVASITAAGDPSVLQGILEGSHAVLFWVGFVGCGIAAPLVAELAALVVRIEPSAGAVAAIAVLVLVGGLCLRLVLVAAGA